jgi:hypothetical protein
MLTHVEVALRLASSFAASSTKSSSHGQDIERFGTVFHHAA